MTKLLIIAFLLPLMSTAQDNPEGCKDHPLFTRMKGFEIASCKTEYGEEDFVDAGYKLIGGETKLIKVEGNKTQIVYKLSEGQQKPSMLQIRRNYGNAIKSIGGKVIMETNEWDFGNADLITMQHSKGGTTIWAQVYLHHFADGAEYVLTIVEPEEMEQEIDGKDLLNEINEKGFVSFQINFATNSSKLGSDAQPVIDQILSLLKADPALKLRIDGHTDNVGDASANLKLSESRAQSVMKAVIEKMPESASRLSAKGWGQTKPVADNKTNEGRAQNRRVEVVKL